ncbi:DUF1800 family protein [Arcicella sp. LKC2W]|uniref:DUF1800 domain-containing protein n=1 Tax=Arcicella sp. LKC2W TaxID=2984198 RepID=UPI002B20A256|nr:DUF1800 family protein [Arcicella sp. LKC2W]MEA5461248.1 DUF1800 family protein [Arcicella sp. LKC2W]
MKLKLTVFFITLFSLNFNIHGQQTVTFGLGNVKNVTVSSSSQSIDGTKTLQSSGYLPNYNSASRFLSHATLGAKMSDIQSVATLGKEQWIDNQLNLSNSFSIENYLRSLHQLMVDSMLRDNPAGGYTLDNTGVQNWHFDASWFQGSMTAPDVLRWRTALALSEIFVISRVSNLDGQPYGLANYYDILLNEAFGNYRTILDKITYHPAMGSYLTFLNNHATNTTKQIYPDENYAREIMQLFSIGLYKLNLDGSEMKDANNKSIPTYTNTDITALAKVFTGLGWGDRPYLGHYQKDKWSYTQRMKFFPLDSLEYYQGWWQPRIYNGHEPGSKTFLGSTIPNRPVVQGEQDIQDALNIIFNHPNVGPFMARRLIQRLVSSNPSPAYIQRVATVFNNNGAGVRGDLKAVVRAILLDQEACDCNADSNSNYAGMLREPFVRYMNLMRGLKLTTQGGVYRNTMYTLYNRIEQIPLYSPTVFNFFQPDYSPDGDLKTAKKYAPEFQLLNSQTLTAYVNALNSWLVNDDPVEFWGLFSNETYKPDQDARFDLLSDSTLAVNEKIPQLLDKYNLILAHGAISKENIEIIRKAIISMPYTYDYYGRPYSEDVYRRIRMAIFLIMISPDYLINR